MDDRRQTTDDGQCTTPMRREAGSSAVCRLWSVVALTLALYSVAFAADVFPPRPDGSRFAQYAAPEDTLYKSPVQLLLSRDGQRLYVACEGTSEILVVNTVTRDVIGAARVGGMPFGMVMSRDGRTLYVSNRRDNTVSVVDVETLGVTGHFPVGDDPHTLLLRIPLRQVFTDLAVVDSGGGTYLLPPKSRLEQRNSASSSSTPWLHRVLGDESRASTPAESAILAVPCGGGRVDVRITPPRGWTLPVKTVCLRSLPALLGNVGVLAGCSVLADGLVALAVDSDRLFDLVRNDQGSENQR